jgi:hypothetical protein
VRRRAPDDARKTIDSRLAGRNANDYFSSKILLLLIHNFSKIVSHLCPRDPREILVASDVGAALRDEAMTNVRDVDAQFDTQELPVTVICAYSVYPFMLMSRDACHEDEKRRARAAGAERFLAQRSSERGDEGEGDVERAMGRCISGHLQ